MARISRDNTSWKASGVEKRDFQHDHSNPPFDLNEYVTPNIPCEEELSVAESYDPPGGEPFGNRRLKRKNRNRWCAGKRGVEHEYEWKWLRKYGYGRQESDYEKTYGLICKNCGRAEKICWPGGLGRIKDCSCPRHKKNGEKNG